MTSIRGRLLLWLLLALITAGISAAYLVYQTAHDEANQIFDYHLKQIALTLRDQPFEDQDILGTLEEEAEYDFVIQIWDPKQTRLYSSHAQAGLPQDPRPGFQTLAHDGKLWRVFLLSDEGLNIQIAQPIAVRQNRAARLALKTVTPFVALLPIMALLIWITVSRGMSPLDALARDLMRRDHNSLAPFSESRLPAELQPMVGELNNLLGRLERAIETQRAFTADAAHELRTPLTALHLQMQLAERARDPDEQRAAFELMRTGLARCSHLVNQLLTLARNELGGVARKPEIVDLSLVAREVVIEQAMLAQAKQIDLGLTRNDPIRLLGDAEGLRAMIGNLVNNAIRYTPEQGKIDVSISLHDQEALLEISDTGPGIPEADRERVFDRFYRRTESKESGSGIGLAIVKSVALRHGASVTLHAAENSTGLLVRVRFPSGASPVAG
ncbi:MAG: ATP-binding protein [Burkholderiales bacterium]